MEKMKKWIAIFLPAVLYLAVQMSLNQITDTTDYSTILILPFLIYGFLKSQEDICSH